jgi:predicted permease
MLRQSPAFTAVAVLSLALGIGANTAIFSVIDVLMLRPLVVREPDRLVLLSTSSTSSLQYSLFEKLRDGAPTVANLSAVVRTDRYNVAVSGAAGGATAIDGGPVRLALVSGNYFGTIGIGAAMGRTMTPTDDQSASRPVAVISDEYWNRRFARAADVLGRTLTLSDTAYEIVGVTPRGFSGEWVGRPADLWIAIVHQPRVMVEMPVGGLQNAAVVVIGRLESGVTREQAQSAWQIILEQQLQAEAGMNPTPQQLRQIATERIEAASGRRGYSPQRDSFGQSLGILMSAVGLVLLVACANIANLLLARSEARQREMAVRLAVGASRARVIRQLLTESVLLAAIGGLLGVLVAQWATATLAAFVRAGPASGAAAALSMDLDVHPDARILAFTAALCLLTGVVFGLAPAFRGSRIALSSALIGRGPLSGAVARGHFTLGKLLVVLQVALSLVLVIGAGLFVRTLRNLTMQELGFDRDHLLLVWALPGQTGGRGAAAADFWRRAQDRVASLPGVVSVSASNQGVLNGSDLTGTGNGPGLRIEGEPPVARGIPGLRSFVAPGFFNTMGIPLLAGRDFTEKDTASAPRGVIVSQSLARHYFGDRDPVGHRIWFPEDPGPPTTIIGVVKDFLIGNPRETQRRPGTTYFSYRDREAPRRLRNMTMAVRTAGEPLALAGNIRRELQDASLQLPVLKIDSVDEQLGDVLVQERMVTTVSSAFGALSLLLACLGLYGVISYAVVRRTSEIGVRMALGATRGDVLRTILAESMMLVAVGIAIGVPAMLAVSRLVAARLFGVGPADPVTIAGAIVVLAAAAAVAAFLPARRAARVDPMVALRCE